MKMLMIRILEILENASSKSLKSTFSYFVVRLAILIINTHHQSDHQHASWTFKKY